MSIRVSKPGLNSSDYYDGVESQWWIGSTVLLGDDLPAMTTPPSNSRLVPITGIADMASVVSVAAPLTNIVKGYRLNIRGRAVEFLRDVPDNVTTTLGVIYHSYTVKCLELPFNTWPGYVPAAGATSEYVAITAPYSVLVPLWSANETTFKETSNTSETRNYGAPDTTIERIKQTKYDLSIKGFVTRDDTALKLLNDAKNRKGRVLFRHLFPDGYAVEGQVQISERDRTTKTDEDYTNMFKLIPANEFTELDLRVD